MIFWILWNLSWLLIVTTNPIVDRELTRAIKAARPAELLSMREFAEKCIHLPTGEFKGLRFRVERQPFTGLLFDELSSGRWPEAFVTGPSQSGKTMSGHVIPTLYSSVHLQRNLVVGLPDMRMANNKWQTDFLPLMRESPALRKLLPQRGPGSKDGQVKDSVQLNNGVMLKFMTAGGDDTARAGFTAEGGVFVTEAARFSHSGETSVESDPLEQLRARMQSLRRSRRRLVVEGTVTIEEELPWSARSASTQSRIVTPCPHCGVHVCPDREHLIGWEDAESELQAAELAHFVCPECGEAITDEERVTANQECRLLHAGQTIDKRGRIKGDAPATERLWFRFGMYNNLLLSAADIAVDEWIAKQLPEETPQRENAEKKLCQFVWAVPYEEPELAIDALRPGDIELRATEMKRGEIPSDTKWLSIGCDVGMYRCHWVGIAWRENRTGHIFDYATFDVVKRGFGSSKRQRTRAAEVELHKQLRIFESMCRTGWAVSGRRMLPDKVLIDAHYLTDTVLHFCRIAKAPFYPSYGFGTGQMAGHKYTHPKTRTRDVRVIGDQYYVRRNGKHRVLQYNMDADHWKSAFHRMWHVDSGEPGGLSIFVDNQHHHQTFERHILAETLAEKIDPRHGRMRVWQTSSSANHYLDAAYAACVGGHHAGFRLHDEPPKKTSKSMGQGGNWFASRRGK